MLRWPIVFVWAVALVALGSDGVPGFGRDGLTLEELAPADAIEIATEQQAAQLFTVPLAGRAQVVRRDAGGLPERVQVGDVEAAIERTREVNETGGATGSIGAWLPYPNTLGVLPASSEASTTTLTHVIGVPDATMRSQERGAERFAQESRERSDVGRVSVTGGIPAQLETGRVIRDSLGTLQLASLIVLVLITAAWFRALVPPLVVLATIGATMLLLLEALAWLGRELDVQVPAEVLPVVLVVAVGVSTDYALFHVATWRRLVLDGVEPRDAVQSSITVNSPVVFTAGLTTAIGASSLWFAETAFIAAFGPALVVAIAVAMVVGLLFVPALFAILGPRLAWPRSVESLRPRGRVARWLVGLLRFRLLSVAVVVVTVAGVVALATQVRAQPAGFNVVTGLPGDHEISIGARDASEGLAPGILSPTLLVVDGDDLDSQLDELAAFSDRVGRIDGVAGVIGPRALRDVELAVDRSLPHGVLVSDDGAHARLAVVLDADPYTGTAVEILDDLRPRLEPALADAGVESATVRVAGDTAIVDRIVEQLDRDLLRIAAFLVPFELVVLLVFLRSLVVAAVIVASSVATTAAALGTLAIYDRTIGPGDGIAFFVPVATFVLLLSIGADYGVLMGSALRRAAREGHHGLDGARVAMLRVGPTIVLAGLVLASTFGLLAIVPLDAFQQFAIAMGSGVLIDTLLMRPIVMPLALAWRTRPTAKTTEEAHDGSNPGIT